MPYGYPWELTREPKGYRCPKCNGTSWGVYQPFCGQCGNQLPPKERLVLTGYAEHYDRLVGRARTPEEINAVLAELGDVEIWLQMYSSSHRETELRVRRPGGRFDGDFSLIAGGTLSINVRVDSGWIGQLVVREVNANFQIADDSVEASVICDAVALYEFI